MPEIKNKTIRETITVSRAEPRDGSCPERRARPRPGQAAELCVRTVPPTSYTPAGSRSTAQPPNLRMSRDAHFSLIEASPAHQFKGRPT